MNEHLFNEAAQIRSDRQHSKASWSLRSQLPSIDAGPMTRHVVAFAAAALVNLAVLGLLQWTAGQARYTPTGEVVITELDAPESARLAKN